LEAVQSSRASGKDAITGTVEEKTGRQLSAVSRTLLLDGTNSRSAGSSAMGRGDAENDYPDKWEQPQRKQEGQGWADMKPTTADNTYAKDCGSKRN